ncbi:MAG: hypothetical protein IPF83_09810 [Rhodanobacteraceae bacterium]|nr:hypothetical protein [Rhodanobacteraceae bacterium]
MEFAGAGPIVQSDLEGQNSYRPFRTAAEPLVSEFDLIDPLTCLSGEKEEGELTDRLR